MERLTQVRTGACFGRLVGSVDVWRVGVSGEALRGVTTNRACLVPRIRIWQTEGCLRCEFATATGIGACEAGTWSLGRQDCDPFGASAVPLSACCAVLGMSHGRGASGQFHWWYWCRARRRCHCHCHCWCWGGRAGEQRRAGGASPSVRPCSNGRLS